LITARVPRETLALADLSDVTGNTGNGTTVVMDDAPTIGPNGMVVNGNITGTGGMVRTGNVLIVGTVTSQGFLAAAYRMSGGSPVAGQYIRAADGDGNFFWEWPDKIDSGDVVSSTGTGAFVLAGGPTFTGDIAVGGTVDGVDIAATKAATAEIWSRAVYIGLPTAAERVPLKATEQLYRITRLYGETDTGTVDLTVEWRPEGDAFVSGTSVHATPLVANHPGQEQTGGWVDGGEIPADAFVWLVTSAVSGDPKQLIVRVMLEHA
jgi:hypothetical protein